LNVYELERKPVVEIFQRAARESQAYFETLKRYLNLEPVQFAFNLLTRSGRITYDDLHLRDPRFGNMVDRWNAQQANAMLSAKEGSQPENQVRSVVAPPPLFTPLSLRSVQLPNRVVFSPLCACSDQDGLPAKAYQQQLRSAASGGAGLVLTEPIAISAVGRISPESLGLYETKQVEAWKHLVATLHAHSRAKIGIQLNHAGRRGSTRPRAEGLDIPLREGNWSLLSASPIPYTPSSQVPEEMGRADMDRVHDDFMRATRRAHEAGLDLVQLNAAQGYLLSSFISPLTNHRQDEYGGDLEHRMRFPLEVFDAMRVAWPLEKPIAVTLSASDCVRGGLEVDDAVRVARMFKDHGCDIIAVVTGQTTIDSEPTFGRGFLTPYSDRLRYEAGIPTMVGGYLTTSDEINTILAAGRADLCIMNPPHLNDLY
jgi:anthraniloyl-CoA monooxygenase